MKIKQTEHLSKNCEENMSQVTFNIFLFVTIYLYTVPPLSCGVCFEHNENGETKTLVFNLEEPFVITDFIKQNRLKEMRNYSSVDSGFMKGDTSYSGFVTVEEKYDSNMFYWYFPCKADDCPLIIYLEGGPGSSTLTAAMHLTGLMSKPNVTKWTDRFSMLFIDSPIGTGYGWTNSTEGYANCSQDFKTHLYSAVQQLFEGYPELKKSSVYIVGSSYVGKFAPLLAEAIHENKDDGCNIDLKGIALGNPMIGPEDIAGEVTLAYETGQIDLKTAERLWLLEDQIKEYVSENKPVEAFKVLARLLAATTYVTGSNVYNFLSGGTAPMDPKVALSEVLHAGKRVMDANFVDLSKHAHSDFVNTAHHVVENLLENGYQVLVYSGHLDRMIPYKTTSEHLHRLRWQGSSEFANATRNDWRENDKLIGYQKHGGGLSEVLIRGAGHGVIFEKQELVFKLIQSFTDHKPLPHTYNPCYFDCLLHEQLDPYYAKESCRNQHIVELIECICEDYCASESSNRVD